MRILVSGSNGFIGSTLCPMLEADGHEVIRFMRYASGRFNGYASGNEQEKVVFADLLDPSACRKAIVDAKPNVVVHLAAQSSVAYSFLHPMEVNHVNYMGTVAVLNAAIEAGAILLHASTSECYGNGRYTYPINEDVPLGGTSPYAASKVACEEAIRVAGRSSGLRYVILRPHNTVGRAPVLNRQFVVERAITQAIEDHRIDLHDPRPYRDFLFRTDHAGAYRSLVRDIANGNEAVLGEVFNVCTGDAWSIEEMAHRVAKVVEVRLKHPVEVSFKHVPDRPLDIPRLQGSNAKITAAIGWRPQYTIALAIEKAADEWIKVLS